MKVRINTEPGCLMYHIEVELSDLETDKHAFCGYIDPPYHQNPDLINDKDNLELEKNSLLMRDSIWALQCFLIKQMQNKKENNMACKCKGKKKKKSRKSGY